MDFRIVWFLEVSQIHPDELLLTSLSNGKPSPLKVRPPRHGVNTALISEVFRVGEGEV